MSDMQEIINSADIREIKLISGDTLIGEIMGVHEKYLVIHDPYIVDHTSSNGTTMFRKWFFSAESELQYVPETAVMTYAKCREDVKQQYIKYVLEDRAIDLMEDDPDNYEFYTDTPTEEDTVH